MRKFFTPGESNSSSARTAENKPCHSLTVVHCDFEKINHLIELLNKNRKTEWIDVHNLRVLKYGETLHVDCHITLPWYQSLEDSHNQVDSVEQLIKKDFDRAIEFFIHADPCVPPTSCSVCQITDCKHRQSEFKKKLGWNIDNLLPDTEHKI